MKLNYKIDLNNDISFNNKMDFCVGTGKMGLALHQEYFNQLKLVQEKIGFSFIRGHGLFCDDMAIYQEYQDQDGKTKAEYNFTYLDRVFDSYQELNIRPFIELGFMPYKMAAGSQTQFYWKGNVTPPKSYESWTSLVKATLSHLISRYGEKEVLSWPVEVWNEPNLKGFWKDANMEEYFKLYEYTALAVKEVHPDLQVGGPSICGGNDESWIHGFLGFCREKKLPLDFITRHHYTIDKPEIIGHYQYTGIYSMEFAFKSLKKVQKMIDQYPEYRDLPFHITEFNTAYIPTCSLHDTNQNAAYLAQVLSEIGDYCDSYSYWTFGDVFEEQGVPWTPFHGGFGLVANGCIPKPTFWIFQFFKELEGRCILKNQDAVFVKKEDHSICGVLWNVTTETDGKTKELTFELPAKTGDYSIITRRVDEEVCNPLKLWHHMGEPSSLSKKQLEYLKEAATPQILCERKNIKNGSITMDITLAPNGVVYMEIKESKLTSDRGFNYKRAVSTPLAKNM